MNDKTDKFHFTHSAREERNSSRKMNPVSVSPPQRLPSSDLAASENHSTPTLSLNETETEPEPVNETEPKREIVSQAM